jgi:hypothetical protein
VIVADFLLIVGNIQNRDPLFLGLGFLLSAVAFFATLFLTIRAKDETEVDDLTLINFLIYPLIVGVIFTIGAFFDNDIIVQTFWLNIGLIVGLFVIFVYIWYLISKKGNGFLKIEALHVDFHAGAAEQQKMPQFLLASLYLGMIYAIIFAIFKVIFYGIGNNNLAYYWTAWVFLGIVFIVCVLLAFVLRVVKLSGAKPAEAKPSKPAGIYSNLTTILLIAAIFFLIVGNVQQLLWFMVMGILLSIIVLICATLLTTRSVGETEIDNISVINHLLYALILGDIFTFGSLARADPIGQVQWLDIGLIVGGFGIFAYIWYIFSEKGWSFLKLDALQVDLHTAEDKQKLPRFFLVSLIFGVLFVLFLTLFKLMYYNGAYPAGGSAIDLAYSTTAYVFITIAYIVYFMLAFGIRLLRRYVLKKK